jgi:hypothetical protein
MVVNYPKKSPRMTPTPQGSTNNLKQLFTRSAVFFCSGLFHISSPSITLPVKHTRLRPTSIRSSNARQLTLQRRYRLTRLSGLGNHSTPWGNRCSANAFSSHRSSPANVLISTQTLHLLITEKSPFNREPKDRPVPLDNSLPSVAHHDNNGRQGRESLSVAAAFLTFRRRPSSGYHRHQDGILRALQARQRV